MTTRLCQFYYSDNTKLIWKIVPWITIKLFFRRWMSRYCDGSNNRFIPYTATLLYLSLVETYTFMSHVETYTSMCVHHCHFCVLKVWGLIEEGLVLCLLILSAITILFAGWGVVCIVVGHIDGHYCLSVNVYLFLRIFVPDGKNILVIFFLQNFFHGILFP